MSEIEEGQPPVEVIQTDDETGVQVKVVSPSGEAVPVDPGSPIDKSAVTAGPEVDAQAQPPSGNAALNDVTQVKETETDKLYKDLFPATLFYPPQSEKITVRKVLVLFNPVSGNGTGETKAQEASKLFADRHITVEQRRLDHSGHAKEIVESEDLSPYDALVVIGGDGTLHEAINGIKRRKDGKAIPLGVIAGGTGNSFAREFFGDNLNDVTTAVDHIARGLVVPVDMMHLSFLKDTDTVYSFNSIHWGLASKVVLTAERLRWMGKAVRYTTAALLELLRGSKAVARVTMENVDGSRSVVEGEFCLIVCNNVFSTTGSMKMVPHAKVNDGLVDLILVSSDSTIDLFKMFVSIFSGSHNELPYVHYHQCRGFTIETMAEVKEASSRAATPIGDSSPSSSAGPSSAQATKDDIEAAVDSEAGEAVVDTERKVKGKPKKDAVTNEVLQEVLDVDGELIEGVFTQIHCQLIPRDLRVII